MGSQEKSIFWGPPHPKPRVVVGWLIDCRIVASQLVEFGLMASCSPNSAYTHTHTHKLHALWGQCTFSILIIF